MFEYVTHYYKQNSVPFQSLSALSEAEALKIMGELRDNSPMFERFNHPMEYLENRAQTEEWLRDSFIQKGGKPPERFPIYMVLGHSSWLDACSFDYGHAINSVQIPLSIFSEDDITFTVPDSMVSFSYNKDKPQQYYRPEYHGHIFTLSEAKTLFHPELNNMLEKELPEGTIPYIEAQVWNHQLIRTHFQMD
ncbi:hypothetical protein [Paenibacillus terrigena]|uniref:hypothetical protein n=1 Tax=Paenibacillus terrigena TaxID=369333 RepID=UPI0028D43D49|nr:hypothetical protein [Paenibacillus terrigena]